MKNANAGIKSMQIDAVIIRADGTRVDLGTISKWDSRWYVRLYMYLVESLQRFKVLTTNRS